ncbi:NFU1 iron-sulfur cluster scaffold-like, mitochondrial, partial [Stylophora pistillata]
TEETPNPNVLKFLPGKEILEGASIEIFSAQKGENVPLARRLFRISGIKSLFFGHDFISVTKKEEIEWSGIKADIFSTLMDYFTLHDKVEVQENNTSNASELTKKNEEDEITREIRDLLDTKVRPAVAGDGGDITFERFEDGIVFVKMRGACSGCPSSTLTLKSGIENMLRYYIPEVQEVRATNEESES